MPRSPRECPGGWAYHVLNRANARAEIFSKPGDYQAFEGVLAEAVERFAMRLATYCIMPNHWHLVLWPREDDALASFMQWLTVTHVRRWHAHHHTSGTGHLYQGRFKSFPIQRDEHFLTVARYVEQNPLRARLVRRAENWRWSGLWRRESGVDGDGLLSAWPVPRPDNWAALVNTPPPPAAVEALRRSLTRCAPFGAPAWTAAAAERLGLQSTLRPQGRPRKEENET